jgi:Dolichyl-phosphate-mannose-protein mannosyltransferase
LVSVNAQTIGDEVQAQPGRWQVRLTLVAILLGVFVIRLIRVDQPIVENYVGRQVPTAMVARNLERGWGFPRPRLDTAPFPNLFLVEPPVYELLVVELRRLTEWRLGACGRIVSAAATALGAWGLFGLIRRREGERVAIAGVIAFSLFPVTVRYGRAFQPDALMLGTVLAGVNCWDRAEGGQGRWWLIAGWLFLVLGFAAKITAALVLIPLSVAIMRRRRAADLLLAVTTLVPVLLWYVWANHLIESSGGSRASAENRAIWLAVLGVSALGNPQTLTYLWRFLAIRAFTPLGLALGIWGLCRPRRGRRPFRSPESGQSLETGQEPFDVWRVWGLSAVVTMALLAGKLHHEYYWLILTPAVAAGIGRGWTRLAESQWGLAWGIGLAFFLSSLFLSRSTWQTPAEWNHLETAALRVQDVVPAGSWLVASEPLLYQADRVGCRLEFTATAAARAAAEWPRTDKGRINGPLDLIDFYRTKGARFVADVVPDPGDERRKALHDAIRRRYKIRVDCASVIIAELNPFEISGHGQ